MLIVFLKQSAIVPFEEHDTSNTLMLNMHNINVLYGIVIPFLRT